MEIVQSGGMVRGDNAVSAPEAAAGRQAGGGIKTRAGHPPLNFLLCSVPSDSHMWNLVALQLVIEEMGHRVVNLGPCTPIDQVIGACLGERPDCVVVSTVNGYGHVDGARLIVALRSDPRLASLPAVIGGKLGVHGDRDAGLGVDLRRLGYDATFSVGAADAHSAMAAFRSFVELRFERMK